MSPPRILVIGAGSRGHAYARAITSNTGAIVAAVAEPLSYKRAEFGRSYIWGPDGPPQEGQEFADWKEFLAYETQRREKASTSGSADVPPGVDAAFVCVLDEMHRDVVVGLGPLGLHIMCEKPLATTLEDCLEMRDAILGTSSSSASSSPSSTPLFAIGHVLRYSPHNILLRKLLLSDRAIGDVVSVEHTEPVGWWHFSHSYVRGNWRRESTTAPSLLTKSCHDVDLLLWLLSAPFKAKTSNGADGDGSRFHLPSAISSTGSLHGYRKARKPAAAGNATNCMSCPLGDAGCKYSAKNIYLGSNLAGLGAGNMGWPVKIVAPEIEDAPARAADSGAHAQKAKELVASKLAEDYDETTPDEQVAAQPWFGRCVFEADNDVCDDQFVTFRWEDEEDDRKGQDIATRPNGDGADAQPRRFLSKHATLHMAASTKKICQRYTHVYGTEGEIYADSTAIVVEDFNTGETTTYHPRIEDSGHGGGDVGLARQFVSAVDKVKNEGWDVADAQNEYMGCTVDEAVRSHAFVFAAEEARREGTVVEWGKWWDAVLRERGARKAKEMELMNGSA